jgi:tripartite ATP-independent transporter DctM subunit
MGRSIEWISVIVTIAMTVVVFLQVTNRYIFNNPLSWTEEVARFLFVWITFLGAFLALKSKAHIGVNSFVALFSTRTRTILENVVIFLMIFYLLFLIQVGSKIVYETAHSLSPALNIPYAYLYISIPASAILMVSHLTVQLFHSRSKTMAFSGIISIASLILLYLLLGGGGVSSGTLVLFAILLLATLILINTPIAFSLGLSSLLFLILLQRTPLIIIPNRMVGGIDSFPFLACPFFILAGELMNTGGITQRLVNLAKAIVGHVRGGLGMVVVVAEYFFSGISGSTMADVSAIGSLLVPAMMKAGYKPEYAVCIVSAASAMGILVPPCITMVILGVMTGLSVGALFMAGFIPAVVLAICIMVLIYLQAFRGNLPLEKRLPLIEAFKSIIGAIIPLMLPVIIFAGILSGAATATEISVIAVLYSFIVGAFVYKEIKLNHIIPILLRTVTLTGAVAFLLGASSVLSWIFATNQVPQMVGALILGLSSAPWVFLLLSNIVFILLGAALEGTPAIIILIPIFYPIISQFGIDPLHYCILVVTAIGIGVFLPPIGMGIFIACSFAHIDMGRCIVPFMPFVIVLFIGLLIISFFPWFTLVLPNIFFPIK